MNKITKLNLWLMALLIAAVSLSNCGQIERPSLAQQFDSKAVIIEKIPVVEVIPEIETIPWSPEETAAVQNALETQPKVITGSYDGQALPSYFSEAVQYFWCLGKIQSWADNAYHGIKTVTQTDFRLASATIIQIESCGHPGLTSTSGAMSLWQVMPFHFGTGEDGYEVETNAAKGSNYFAGGIKKAEAMGYSGLDALAEAAKGYNAGHGNIGKQMTVNSQAWRYELYFRGFMTRDEQVIQLFFARAQNMCDKASLWLKIQPPCQ